MGEPESAALPTVRRWVKCDVMREDTTPGFLPHLTRYVLASDFDAAMKRAAGFAAQNTSEGQ